MNTVRGNSIVLRTEYVPGEIWDMHETVEKIHAKAADLRAEHALCDAAGKLTNRTAEIVRESQGMRLLQSKRYGGYEASLPEFFAWVRATAQYNPSAGWVAGVVGIHPWEIALVDPKLQDEIFIEDNEMLVASPYAPMGIARPVDGGYILNGEWPYSTGCDLCRWTVLGGLVSDANGKLPEPPALPEARHFFLPWGDYEIVEGSWNVMGLSGTGSKNVRVKDAFIPAHRTVGHVDMCDGAYNDRQPDNPMYHIPFAGVFSAAICAATFGIARGTLDAYLEQLQTRVSISGVTGKADPYQQEALAEAEADLAAGIVHLDVMSNELVDKARRGEPTTMATRLEFRRNQVRAVQRVLRSVDRLLSRAGSGAIWSTKPVERYWRDLRTAATHVCNVTDVVYRAWANEEFQLGEAINAFV